MIRTAAALVGLVTLAACGLPRLRPVEVGDTLVYDTREVTARVTVERVGDCEALRADTERLMGPGTAWIDQVSEGQCAWASGTLVNHILRVPDLPLTVVDGVRAFGGFERAD